MVTAAQRRRAVDHLTSRRVSQRRACRLAHFSRSAAWYRPGGRNDEALRQRLTARDLGQVSVERHNGVHRVRLGPVASRTRAERLMERLRAAGFNAGHIVTLE